jgi:hypothetical protein
MRSRRPVAVTLVALTAGLAASAVLRRIAARRRSAIGAPTRSVSTAPSPAVLPAPAVDREAVVLTFSPRTVPVPAPQQPVRCGDTGGRTKAGAPCGARATADGRCRHHRIAA